MGMKVLPELRSRAALIVGIVLTIIWLAACYWYVDTQFGWENLWFLLPDELAMAFAGIAVPLAFLWLTVAYFARTDETRHLALLLQHQLDKLSSPTKAAEQQIATVVVALQRQSDELRQAGKSANEILESVRQS